MKPLAAAVIVTVLATVAANAAETTPQWLCVRVGDIEIYSAASAETTVDIAQNLERMRASLGQVTQLNVAAEVPTRVFVFQTEDHLRPFARAIFGADVAKAGAFVSHGDGNYILLDASARSAAERLAYHELVHFFIRNTWESIPLSLNEGIADLYSTFNSYKQEIFFAQPLPQYLRRLRRQKLIPLAELLRINEQSGHYIGRVDQGRFYAESWALVHYLALAKQNGWNELGRFLALIGEGTEIDRAFNTAFGMSYAVMERELQRYIRRPMLQSMRFVVRDLKLRSIGAPRSVSPDEISAALGDLMLHTPHGRSLAREYLVAAIKQNSASAPAKATLALILGDEGNKSEASRLLSEAASEPLSDEDVRFWPALRKAKQFGDARDAANALQEKEIARQAVTLDLQRRHDDEIHRYNRAVEMARTQDFKSAIALLDELIAGAEGETVINAAKELKDEIEKALKKR
jgi:hypothetical protein